MKHKETRRAHSNTREKTGKIVVRKFGHDLAYTSEHAETIETKREVEGEVELTLDLDAIMRRLSWGALTNKTGRCSAMNGLIVAKRVGALRVISEVKTGPDALREGESYK